MSSTKCIRCGLVNFADAADCKRCHRPLDRSGAAANIDYDSPPPPPVFHGSETARAAQTLTESTRTRRECCIKCGSNGGVSEQEFKKSYVPPAVYGAAIAPLLLLILISIFKVSHTVRAPFCDRCWERFGTSKIVLWVAGTVSMVLAAGSIFAFTIFDSIVAFMVAVIGSVAAYIGGYVYYESSAPKFKKVDGKVVVIETATMGEVNYCVGA